MGKWNRKWLPRQIYHQEPPGPPTRSQNVEPPSGFGQSSVPLWEKKYCTSVGCIPWWKVVDAKKFMYSHTNVLNWNDSAGEEAFQNAKKRFWELMNGLPCKISLPDPNMYIDEIDWNPQIDPDLILQLEKEYVAPDDGEKKYDDTNQKGDNVVSVILQVHDRDPNNSENPWECNYMQERETLKNKEWGGGDKQWGWNFKENDCEDPWQNWDQGFESLNRGEWGKLGSNSWHWNQYKNSSNDLWRSGFSGGYCGDKQQEENKWGNKVNGSGRTYNNAESRGGKSWGWKKWECNDDKKWEKNGKEVGGSWSRKREGTHQHVQRNKSLRFQVDGNQTGHNWRKGRFEKRVSFAV